MCVVATTSLAGALHDDLRVLDARTQNDGGGAIVNPQQLPCKAQKPTSSSLVSGLVLLRRHLMDNGTPKVRNNSLKDGGASWLSEV